jgi:hypothetical protein
VALVDGLESVVSPALAALSSHLLICHQVSGQSQGVTIDSNDYMVSVRRRMVADDLEVSEVQLPSGAAIVGYRNRFSLAWFATKLHLFVVAAAVDSASNPLLVGLTRESVDYAKATKGSLRGFQTGVAVMPILVCRNVPADVAAAATSRPGKEFAAFNLPAVVDTTHGVVHTYRDRIVWGGIYARWLRERQAAIVGDSAR